jgi:hypothetical protein
VFVIITVLYHACAEKSSTRENFLRKFLENTGKKRKMSEKSPGIFSKRTLQAAKTMV